MTPTNRETPDRHYIFDFDSTLVQVESLPELARISLKNHPERLERLHEVERITDLTASGNMSMVEGLTLRIELLDARRGHLETLVRSLKRIITPSVKRNRAFFKKFRDRIFVLSNGFHEFIEPVVESLGLRRDHVFANRFVFDEQGRIVDFDRKRHLCRQEGKARQLKELRLPGEILVIGDGFSDFRTKRAGVADRFYAFTENVRRESIVSRADHVLPSLDEFLYIHQFPMTLSYPKSRIRALILEDVHPSASRCFEREGYTVHTLSASLPEDALIEKMNELDGVTVLGIRSRTRITERVVRGAERLKAIGAFCIGVNQIDLTACARAGVIVFNAPFSNTRSVVELAVGEIIMLARRVATRSRTMHRGQWHKTAEGAFEIRGKRLGIIGYGNIGSQLSVLAEAMGMHVAYYDIVEKLPLGNATKCRSMHELLKRSDVVSLHVDGSPHNHHLIGTKQLRLMRAGSLLLNLSRGHVVDHRALASSLRSGHLGGAAIDVFPDEPQSNEDTFSSELRDLENVILTPHIGGSTVEAQENIAASVAEALVHFINSGNSFGSVNFPQVQLPVLRRAHRFIHVHHNEPGVLAAINRIMANHQLNILGQHLKTDEHIGYVITDVGTRYNKEVIENLRSVSKTISFRVLY